MNPIWNPFSVTVNVSEAQVIQGGETSPCFHFSDCDIPDFGAIVSMWLGGRRVVHNGDEPQASL